MSWNHISALLPRRTVFGCQEYYSRPCKLGPAWPQERKNKLCKLYESLESSMWAKIGEELNVPWEVVEDMHWRLGAAEMAERARVPLSTQADFRFAPLEHDIDDAELHQHRDQEHNLVQQSSRHSDLHSHPSLSQSELSPMTHEGQPGSSVTVPSLAEITTGVEMLWRPPPRET
ncbi:hypothetical protein E4U61_001396 [Claviceps capensis]|nr:hypothetical protein E4U61_001396 [Claviceps capensis]